MIQETPRALGWAQSYFAATGYDAVDQNGKRRTVSSVLKSEDDHLRPNNARQVVAQSRDLSRNFALVGWVIRQHLNYLTEFNFQCRTGIDAFDAQVESLMSVWSRPANCEATGRHEFAKLIRMVEKAKVTDGDVFLLKLSEGVLQPIEYDRVRNPSKMEDPTQWVNGVRINKAGRPVEFAIHKRINGGQFQHEKNVSAASMLHYAHFERFDQVRGISPLVAAINSFKDVYEAIDLALAKLKVEQLFALAITRDATEATGDTTGNESDGYEVDFKKGPIKLEMDPGDKAEFLKSDNPGAATQDFIKLVIRLALTSLDLPYGLFDTGDTNFFGGKAGFMVYERSLISKIRDLQNLLRQVTVWKLRQWIISGELTLPAGMTVGDIAFEWVHRGMPWWDASKEIDGDLAAIGAGLSDPYTICKKRGMGEFEENVRNIKKARDFAASMGVPITFDRAGNKPMPEPAKAVAETSEDDPEDMAGDA